MDALREASMTTALDVASVHGGAVAALRARGVERLGDDVPAPGFAAFLTAPASGVGTIAECIALGYLWRDLAGEARGEG